MIQTSMVMESLTIMTIVGCYPTQTKGIETGMGLEMCAITAIYAVTEIRYMYTCMDLYTLTVHAFVVNSIA